MNNITFDVTIHNKTRYAWERTTAKLTSGDWKPGINVIEPGRTVDIGAYSDYAGVQGELEYSLRSTKVVLRIAFDLPLVGEEEAWISDTSAEHGYVRVERARTGSPDHQHWVVTVEETIERSRVTPLGNTTGPLSSAPFGAVSWEPGGTSAKRIDVFARTEAGGLAHMWIANDEIYDWEVLRTGAVASGLAASSWKRGRLDAFAVDMQGDLIHVWYDDANGWGRWDELAGGLAPFAPAAVSWGPNRLDILAVGKEGDTRHLWWDGSWRAWESLDDRIGTIDIRSGIGVASRGVNRLSIFAIDSAGRLQYAGLGLDGWLRWRPISTNDSIGLLDPLSMPLRQGAEQAPRAVHFGSSIRVYSVATKDAQAAGSQGQIHGFASDDDGKTWHRFLATSAFKNKGFWGGVGVSAPTLDRVDLFAYGQGDVTHHAWSTDGLGQKFHRETIQN